MKQKKLQAFTMGVAAMKQGKSVQEIQELHNQAVVRGQ